METCIAIAVVESRDSFLIGQRPSGATLAGYWEFPGGRVERGESARDAAVRECLEETGLAVTVVGSYPDVRHQYEHGSVRLQFFACRPLDPAQAPQPPFRWVARRDLASYPFPAANHELLARLLSGRGSDDDASVPGISRD